MVESISRKDSAALWLAGAIDGEGCFSAFIREKIDGPYKLQNLIVKMHLSNTHPVFITRATECLMELGVSFHVSVRDYAKIPKQEHWKPCADVSVSGQGRMRKLLPLIIPHLSCKKPQAELLKELLAYREILRQKFSGGNGAHRDGMGLESDELIAKAIVDLAKLKREHPTVLQFSRKPNQVFGS